MSGLNSAVAQTEGRTGHFVLATVFMVVGSTIVLGAVVTMNELSAPPDRKEVERVTEIEVKPPPKKKKEPKVKKQQPKPRKTPKAPPRPFLKSMASNLSGIAFDLPGLQFEDLGDSAGSLLSTNEDDVVHTSDTVDTPPRPVEQPACKFPSRLQDRGIEGYVTLSLLLNPSGAIERVKVIESKPPGEFDQTALDCVRRWRFEPALYKGEPVKTWARQTMKFKLAGR